MPPVVPGPSRAVLLFARAPEGESRAKRAVTRGGLSAARRIHELLLRRTLAALSRLPTDVAVVIATDVPARLMALARAALPRRTLRFLQQTGSTPGERLCNAVAAAEALVPGALAVIGADTPGLGTAR